MVLICAGMILPAAFMFMVTADLPHVFVFTLIGVVLSLLTIKPFRYSDRTVIYGLLVAAVLAVIFDLIFPVDNQRLGIFGGVFRANITAPLLLYLAVIATFFESSPQVFGISACLSLAVLILGGDVLSHGIVNARLPFFKPLMQNLRQFCVVIVAIDVFFLLLGLIYTSRIMGKGKRSRWLKTAQLIRIAIIVLVPVISFVSVKIYTANEHYLRSLERYFLGIRRARLRRPGQVVFNRIVDLNRTISPDIEKNQALIVLRAMGRTAPGYLRGRVYTRYDEGIWTEPPVKEARLEREVHAGILAYNTFFLNKDMPFPDMYHIYPSRYFSSDVLLYPGNSGKFDIVADWMKCSTDGIITMEGWEKDGGYTCYVPRLVSDSAFPRPDDTVKPGSEYLEVPKPIEPVLKQISGRMAPPRPDGKVNSRQVIARISGFLKENYKYKLGTKEIKAKKQVDKTVARINKYLKKNLKSDIQIPENLKKDPVINFLEVTKAGHCELFASSASLLLRVRGIPTRYVTGFVCSEPHPSKNYYVARLGNAHAWLEAYLEKEKRWILVEPTPPSGVPNFQYQWGMFETWYDWLLQMIQKILADMRRGYFAEAIIAFFTTIFSMLWYLLSHPVLGPVTLLIIAWFIFRRYRKRQLARSKISISRAVIKLHEEFIRFQNAVSKKLGVVRSPADTIMEWRKKLESAENPPGPDLAEILHRYQNLRYRPEPPSEEESASFRKELRTYIRKH